MDSTLLGVVIGSILAIIGNFFSHLFIIIKDEKQWKRQQFIEHQNQLRKDQKDKWDIYSNCLNALSLLGYPKLNTEEFQLNDEDLLDLYRDAHKWLTLFAMQLDDSFNDEIRKEFYSEFRYFWQMSDIHSIERLHGLVMKLVIGDKELSTEKQTNIEDSNGRTLEFLIDNEYRRKMFIKGVQLPPICKIILSLSDFTPFQRKKLWDIFFDIHKDAPPYKISLPIPKFDKRRNSVDLRGNIWSAQINPFIMKPKEILQEWEKSFEEALIQAEKECQIHDNDSEKSNSL